MKIVEDKQNLIRIFNKALDKGQSYALTAISLAVKYPDIAQEWLDSIPITTID